MFFARLFLLLIPCVSATTTALRCAALLESVAHPPLAVDAATEHNLHTCAMLLVTNLKQLPPANVVHEVVNARKAVKAILTRQNLDFALVAAALGTKRLLSVLAKKPQFRVEEANVKVLLAGVERAGSKTAEEEFVKLAVCGFLAKTMQPPMLESVVTVCVKKLAISNAALTTVPSSAGHEFSLDIGDLLNDPPASLEALVVHEAVARRLQQLDSAVGGSLHQEQLRQAILDRYADLLESVALGNLADGPRLNSFVKTAQHLLPSESDPWAAIEEARHHMSKKVEELLASISSIRKALKKTHNGAALKAALKIASSLKLPKELLQLSNQRVFVLQRIDGVVNEVAKQIEVYDPALVRLTSEADLEAKAKIVHEIYLPGLRLAVALKTLFSNSIAGLGAKFTAALDTHFALLAIAGMEKKVPEIKLREGLALVEDLEKEFKNEIPRFSTGKHMLQTVLGVKPEVAPRLAARSQLLRTFFMLLDCWKNALKSRQCYSLSSGFDACVKTFPLDSGNAIDTADLDALLSSLLPKRPELLLQEVVKSLALRLQMQQSCRANDAVTNALRSHIENVRAIMEPAFPQLRNLAGYDTFSILEADINVLLKRGSFKDALDRLEFLKNLVAHYPDLEKVVSIEKTARLIDSFPLVVHAERLVRMFKTCADSPQVFDFLKVVGNVVPASAKLLSDLVNRNDCLQVHSPPSENTVRLVSGMLSSLQAKFTEVVEQSAPVEEQDAAFIDAYVLVAYRESFPELSRIGSLEDARALKSLPSCQAFEYLDGNNDSKEITGFQEDLTRHRVMACQELNSHLNNVIRISSPANSTTTTAHSKKRVLSSMNAASAGVLNDEPLFIHQNPALRRRKDSKRCDSMNYHVLAFIAVALVLIAVAGCFVLFK